MATQDVRLRLPHYAEVGLFHEKFKLASARNEIRPRLIDDPGLQTFRLKFMREELDEYSEAIENGDLPKALDALVDLVYVAMGTAHLHGAPWQALWDEVQRANMAKERCEINHPYVGDGQEACRDLNCDGYCGAPQHKHSLRGNINDVIKPPGWTPPDIEAVLRRYGWRS